MSLHLARFTPAKAVRTVGALWRGRQALATTPGLATSRLFMLAELDRAVGGHPTPTRWGLLCGWETPEARDTFCAHGADRFTGDAREAWGLSLETVRVRKGGLRGWIPPTVGVERLAPDEPLIVMTHARLRSRHVWDFTVDNRRIVREMTGNPGLSVMVGIIDHPLTRATISVWRSQRDVVRFAYRDDGIHNPVQKESVAVPWADDFFFARFRPVATTGSWGGSDPLAIDRAAEPASIGDSLKLN